MKIAFVSDNVIWVMDPTGHNMIVLTDPSMNAGLPAWSPDSTEIAFMSNNVIWVMDADGDNKIALTDDQSHASQPTWSRKPASNVPEFPSAILPAAMIIGFLGVVLLIRRT
jgi:Tol biopolymer transport system component